MTRKVVSVIPTIMRRGLERLFSRYRLRAIPVADENNKLVGVVREKGRLPQKGVTAEPDRVKGKCARAGGP